MATVCAPPSSPAGAGATLVYGFSLPQAQFCGQSLLMAEPPAPPPPQTPEDALKAAQAASKTSQFQDVISQPVVAAFCAGGVAGAVSRTVVSPLERLKILFQIQSAGRTEYKLSVGKALGKMWKEEGWKGFMRGNGTNCIRIVPYSAVQFGSYNFYRRVRPFACFLTLPAPPLHPAPSWALIQDATM